MEELVAASLASPRRGRRRAGCGRSRRGRASRARPRPRARAAPSSRRGRRPGGRSSSSSGVTRKRKHVGGDVLLGGREPAERVEQVVLDDPLRRRRAPRARASVERVRARRDGRRARAAPARAGGTAPRPRSPRRLRRRGVVRAAGERRAGRRRPRRSPRRRAPARSRTAARRAAERRFHSAIGPLDRLARRRRGRGARRGRSSRTARGMRPSKRSSFAQRVLADREQDVHAQVGSLTIRGSSAANVPVAVLVGVVEEVLLELVEDDEQRPHAARSTRAASRRAARPAARPAAPRRRAPRHRGPDRLGQRRAAGRRATRGTTQTANGAARRPAAFARTCSRRSCTTPACSSERLADPARPVEDRQPRRAQVRGDDLPSPASRPKKKSASSSSYGTSPTYGRLRRGAASGACDGASVSVIAAAPRRRASRSSRSTYSPSVAVEEVDVLAAAPRASARSRARFGSDGSRCTAHDLRSSCSRAPDPVQDHAQVPVAHRVAEEEEVAVRHPLATARSGSARRRRRPRGSRCSCPR